MTNHAAKARWVTETDGVFGHGLGMPTPSTLSARRRAARAEAYAKDSEPRLTVLADAVLPLRRARKRQPREPERAAAYDDAIPF